MYEIKDNNEALNKYYIDLKKQLIVAKNHAARLGNHNILVK